MRLTFAQFKKKLAETKAKIAQALATKEGAKKPGKLSSTQKKARRRAWKTGARAACDSLRWRQKHHLDNVRHPRRALRVQAARRINNKLRKQANAERA